MPLTRSQGGCAGCCKMPETQLQIDLEETFERERKSDKYRIYFRKSLFESSASTQRKPKQRNKCFQHTKKTSMQGQQQLQLITLVASSSCLHLLQNPISSTETAYFGEIAISSYTEKIILIETKK